jgi:hypothetical protein
MKKKLYATDIDIEKLYFIEVSANAKLLFKKYAKQKTQNGSIRKLCNVNFWRFFLHTKLRAFKSFLKMNFLIEAQ